MKKRWISLLLVACTLLSLFPTVIFSAAAEESLPKDESALGNTSAVEDGALPERTAYDGLYVGADGSTTANGGKLVALFSAFGDDLSSVDLTAGTWTDKMNGNVATLRGAGWMAGSAGGFGFDFPNEDFQSKGASYGVSLPDGLLAATLSVETLGTVKGLRNEDGTLMSVGSDAKDHFFLNNKADASFMRLDLLSAAFFSALKPAKPDESFGNRLLLGGLAFSQHWGGKGKVITNNDGVYAPAVAANGNKPVALGTYYAKVTGGDGSQTYTVAYGDRKTFSATLSAAAVAEYEAQKSTSLDKAGVFSFFNGTPSDAYAIRVYSAPLTDAERNHNSFIDLMAYAEVDLTSYKAMSADSRTVVESAMSGYSFSTPAAVLVKAMVDLEEAMKPQVDLADILYVKQGLVGLYAGYANYDTGTLETGNGLTWFNAVEPTKSATIRGAGWSKAEEGGYTIHKTLAEYNADKGFGIYLPVSIMPEKSYTVELVATPEGITVENEDGTRSRYIDQTTPTGTWHEYGIAIGPYRAYQAACYRDAGRDAQMERRWTYSATGGLQAAGWKYRFQDKAWQGLSFGQTTAYTITFAHGENGGGTYRHYSDQVAFGEVKISAEEYVTNDEASNMFQLMVGVAGTIYSVRVYDRVLTKEEMAQNHVADLLYYYDLDISVLLSIMEKVEDMSGLFGAFSGITFDMTKEEAQAEFDACLGAIWMTYSGLGVRGDGRDGLRFYFDISADGVANMAAAGFHMEMGAIVSVDKNTLPVLDGGDYDYKLVAYTSDSGKTNGYFVDNDTFAATLLYEGTEKQIALANILVRGYVKMTASDGESLVFYVDPKHEEYTPDSLFKIFHEMKAAGAVRANASLASHMKEVVDSCFEKTVIYADAAAAAGGNGTKSAPFRSFSEAWEKAKTLLRSAAIPTDVVILLADGEYGIYGTATLTGEDMPYVYSRLEVTSENGKSILSTRVDMDASAFTEYADNIWVYQFEKDANGKYPEFRYLYVDGVMADIAYSTGRHAVDEDVHITAFERTYDGPCGRAEDLYKAGRLTKDSESGYPASRPDLIAYFEHYKKQFLAFDEVEKLFKAEQLTLDSKPVLFTDADYAAAFEKYKLSQLALQDLTKQHNEKNAGVGPLAAIAAFKKFTPSPEYEGHAAYTAEFNRVRNEIAAVSENYVQIGAIKLEVETNAQEIGKYYFALDMVGDFTDELAEGYAKNLAVYNELLKQYTNADDAFKAAMEDELLAAAERVGESTWFRYALEDEEVEMHMAGQWWYNIVGVAGVDYEDTVTDVEGNIHVACYMRLDEYDKFFVHGTYSMVGRYVCLKNALDYVSEEGEMYYDELNGKVYYYTEDGMAGKKVARPTNDYMIKMEDVHDVSFTGLDFTGVDDYYLTHHDGCLNLGGDQALTLGTPFPTRSAIFIENVNGLSIFGCRIYEVGMKGLQVGGQVKNATVESCEIYRTGANAIYFGNCTKSRTGSEAGLYGIENVTITDNYIHDIGLEHHNSTALYMSFGKDTTISHNTIHDCSYTAIGVGLTFGIPGLNPHEDDFYNHYNLDISYNYIYSYLTEIGDAGGIYVTGGNAPKDVEGYFNFMHHNYILLTNTTGNGRGHMLVGLYFDGSTSNWKCYENVVVEHSYGAVAGEDDDLYAEGDPYVVGLRNRFSGTTPIYVQHITSQITHNILLDSNYVVNVRATDPKAQQKEVYKTYIVASRKIVEQNTHYIGGSDRVPVGGEDIMYGAGCYGHTGDPAELYDNDY